MDSLAQYSNISVYVPKSCQQEMEWIFFDIMMPIHAENLGIENKLAIMMSLIIIFSICFHLKFLSDMETMMLVV